MFFIEILSFYEFLILNFLVRNQYFIEISKNGKLYNFTRISTFYLSFCTRVEIIFMAF